MSTASEATPSTEHEPEPPEGTGATEPDAQDDQQGSGIGIGDFDLGLEIVNNRINVIVINKILNKILDKLGMDVADSEMKQMKLEAIREINETYESIHIDEDSVS